MPKNSSSARCIILQPEQHYEATIACMVKTVEYVDFVHLHYVTAVGMSTTCFMYLLSGNIFIKNKIKK